jgi:antitoxin component YwqK of YwqJK toxin-antitoxin module
MYKMGESDGTYKYYYENGQLWVEKEYKNGLLMNVIGNFDPKGNHRDKGTIKDGNGTVNYYTEEGKVYSRQTFQEGKKIMEETY